MSKSCEISVVDLIFYGQVANSIFDHLKENDLDKYVLVSKFKITDDKGNITPTMSIMIGKWGQTETHLVIGLDNIYDVCIASISPDEDYEKLTLKIRSLDSEQAMMILGMIGTETIEKLAERMKIKFVTEIN